MACFFRLCRPPESMNPCFEFVPVVYLHALDLGWNTKDPSKKTPSRWQYREWYCPVTWWWCVSPFQRPWWTLAVSVQVLPQHPKWPWTEMETVSSAPECARLAPHFVQPMHRSPAGFASIQPTVNGHCFQAVDFRRAAFGYFSKSSKRAGRVFLPAGFFAALGFWLDWLDSW